MPRYAFVGHETVGAYVARCLEPLGWSRTADVAEAAMAFTYCTSASALEDAYFDSEGLVKRAKAGTLLVDLSPSTPALAREIAAVATVNDLRVVEAPLAVLDAVLPDAFSTPENLMCFAGGEEDDVDEAIDVLETLFGAVERTGAGGTAQLAKAARTAQTAGIMASAIEADALVRATRAATTSIDGIDVAVMPASREGAPMVAAVATDAFEGTYTVEMLMGEVAAAMTAADDVNLILPQLEAVMHLLEVIAVIGGADKSPAALSLVYREEEASAAEGLDWTRAENLFADHVPGYEHDHDHDHNHGFDDDYGIYGGLGGYSAN